MLQVRATRGESLHQLFQSRTKMESRGQRLPHNVVPLFFLAHVQSPSIKSQLFLTNTRSIMFSMELDPEHAEALRPKLPTPGICGPSSLTSSIQVELDATCSTRLDDDGGSNDSSSSMDSFFQRTRLNQGYIRICPHRTITFGQFQQVAFRLSDRSARRGRTTDIFVKLPHHGRRQPIQDTNPHELDTISLLGEHSQLRYPNIFPFDRPGFHLQLNWDLNLQTRTPTGNDLPLAQITSILKRSNINFCPHIKISHEIILQIIILYMAPPEFRPRNIARLLAFQSRPAPWNHMECTLCETRIIVDCLTPNPEVCLEVKMKIEVSRWLGRGYDGEEDPDWHRQCVQEEDDVVVQEGSQQGRELKCKAQSIRGFVFT